MSGMASLRCRDITPPGGECDAPGGECGLPATIGIVTMSRQDGDSVLILLPVCPSHVTETMTRVKGTVQGDEWAAIVLTDALGGGLR